MSLEKTQTNALLLKYVRELSQALIDKDACIEKLKTDSEKQRKKHQKRIDKLEGAKRHRYLLLSFDPESNFSLDNAIAFGSQSQVIDYIFKEMRILAEPNEIVCALFDGSHTFSSPGRRYFLVKDTFNLSKTSQEKKDDSRLTDARKKLLASIQAKEKTPPSDDRPAERPTKSKSEEESNSEEAKPKKKMMPKKGMIKSPPEVFSTSESDSSDSPGSKAKKAAAKKGNAKGVSKAKGAPLKSFKVSGDIQRVIHAHDERAAAKKAAMSIMKTKVERKDALEINVQHNDCGSVYEVYGDPKDPKLHLLEQFDCRGDDDSSESSAPKAKAKSKHTPTYHYKISLEGNEIYSCVAISPSEAVEQYCSGVLSPPAIKDDPIVIDVTNLDSGSQTFWKVWGTLYGPHFKQI